MGLMAATCVWAEPKGAGYPFDGFTGFVVSNMTEQLSAGNFSVAAWVRLQDVKRPQMFLTMGNPNQDFSLYLYNGGVRMLVEGAEGKYGFALAQAPQSNEWAHYAGTYDGKTAKVYRNGFRGIWYFNQSLKNEYGYKYSGGLGNYFMTSNPEGTVWSERKQTSYIEDGHDQISGVWKNKKTGVAF